MLANPVNCQAGDIVELGRFSHVSPGSGKNLPDRLFRSLRVGSIPKGIAQSLDSKERTLLGLGFSDPVGVKHHPLTRFQGDHPMLVLEARLDPQSYAFRKGQQFGLSVAPHQERSNHARRWRT